MRSDLPAFGLLLAVLFASIMLAPAPGAARTFDTGAYQDADGAITTLRHGDLVDPYYAIKALLAARQGGLDIDGPAQAWIDWMLRHQGRNGLAGRYCRRANERWQRCDSVEAEGPALALWLELLYVQSPGGIMPKPWQASARIAWRSLARLRDPKTGVYRISPRTEGALFTDNVEIHAALKSISGAHVFTRRAGGSAGDAEKLRQDMERVFRPSQRGPFLASADEAVPKPRPYPEHIGQLYPLLYALPAADFDRRAAYEEWIAHHGRDWLRLGEEQEPWGLAALAAWSIGDVSTAHCWYTRAEPLRGSNRWNILDEAAYQRIQHAEPFGKPVCERR